MVGGRRSRAAEGLLAAEVDYLGNLAACDVIVWPEVRTVLWPNARLAYASARIAADDATAVESLDIGVEGGTWRHILEGLPAHGFGEIEREARHLRELASGNIVVRFEARVACRAAARVAADDARVIHRLDVLVEGRAGGH